MKNKEEILKIAVFKRLLTEEDEGYGVKLSIGNQSFKIDYYGDREEAQWMKDMLIRAINNLITQTREETIREVIDKVRMHYNDRTILGFIEEEERKLNKLKK